MKSLVQEKAHFEGGGNISEEILIDSPSEEIVQKESALFSANTKGDDIDSL